MARGDGSRSRSLPAFGGASPRTTAARSRRSWRRFATRSRASGSGACAATSSTPCLIGSGIGRPPLDLQGLRSVYAAWCESVPHENTRKLIHVTRRPRDAAAGIDGGRLLRSLARRRHRRNLLGGERRAPRSPHGARIRGRARDRDDAVDARRRRPESRLGRRAVDGERWIADASILSGEPICIARSRRRLGRGAPLPRFEWLDGKAAVRWRALNAPEGFPCRIERIGATWEEWDSLHQRTAAWSPFNYMLNARLLRGGDSIGAARGQRYVFRADGSHVVSPLEGDGPHPLPRGGARHLADGRGARSGRSTGPAATRVATCRRSRPMGTCVLVARAADPPRRPRRLLRVRRAA